MYKCVYYLSVYMYTYDATIYVEEKDAALMPYYVYYPLLCCLKKPVIDIDRRRRRRKKRLIEEGIVTLFHFASMVGWHDVSQWPYYFPSCLRETRFFV